LRTLKDLIKKTNHENHNEDEGIKEYKIVGYSQYNLASSLLCHTGKILVNG